jgi:hypothetical protein
VETDSYEFHTGGENNMRERLRKDWPITVYKYHVEAIGELPQALWDTAKAMQQLWNDLARLHEDTRKRVSESLKDVSTETVLD